MQAREDMTNMKVKQKTNVFHLRIMVDMNIQESFLKLGKWGGFQGGQMGWSHTFFVMESNYRNM